MSHSFLHLPLQIVLALSALHPITSISVQLEERNSPTADDCVDGPGIRYRGIQAYTKSGIRCQRWDTNKPQVPKYVPTDGGHHHYCRNPDNDANGLWCYTMDPKKRWEHCNVTKCPDETLLLWTDLKSQSTNVLTIGADVQNIKETSSPLNFLNSSVVVDASRVASEYDGVAGSYAEKAIFYVNSKADCLEMIHIGENKSSIYFEGLANNIRAIVYDWINRNLYWTDAVMNWVMATDNTFKYVTPVYRTGEASPNALAIHPVQRKLFFSTYKPLRSEVIATDTAGRNPRIFLQFPSIFLVTSLAIDQTDDRLYVADYWGYGGMVLSSDLDGRNVKRHYFKKGCKFIGIAAYMGYIYMSDETGRYNNRGDLLYSIWVVNKETRRTQRYNLDGEPRGLKVLSVNTERSIDKGLGYGDCESMPPCHQICLPRTLDVRECACSLGFQKSGDVECVPLNLEDNYMVVVDKKQNKLFQFSLDPNVPREYGIIELDAGLKISTVATDPIRQTIFLADPSQYTIIKYSTLNQTSSHVSKLIGPRSVTVDPLSGKLYFFDVISRSIRVTDENGDSTQTIITLSPFRFTSDVKMLALDFRNEMIYFTETNMLEGKGQVWRINYDGTGKQLILNNLHWPHAITVDYRRKSLFVGEAKLMTVIEISLTSLKNITTSISFDKSIHNLRESAGGVNPIPRSYINDVQIYFDTLYFADSHQLRRLNLTSGELETFGPRDFYDISSLALYSTSY